MHKTFKFFGIIFAAITVVLGFLVSLGAIFNGDLRTESTLREDIGIFDGHLWWNNKDRKRFCSCWFYSDKDTELVKLDSGFGCNTLKFSINKDTTPECKFPELGAEVE